MSTSSRDIWFDPKPAGRALTLVDGEIDDSPDLHSFTAARIIVVDDDEPTLRVMARMLARAGYRRVTTTNRPENVDALCDRLRPDLLVLDLHMPHLDGFGVLEAIRRRVRGPDRLPVIVLTGDDATESRRRALGLGARDFVNKPIDAVELLLRIRNQLEARDMQRQLEENSAMLDLRVAERTERLERAHLDMLERLALTAECRDDDTSEHAQRVGRSAALIAAELRLDERTCELIRVAAPLHDIGKVAIPDAILHKPGPLTQDEYELMKTHVTVGGRLLGGGKTPALRMAGQIALCHHERWDGTGYPFGMSGEDIPLVARVVALADVFDVLTHERPYKEAWPVDKSLDEVRRERGKHFDPDVVDAFMRLDHPVLRFPTGSSTIASLAHS